MDRGAARQVILEQSTLAREQLRHRLIELGHEAKVIAELLGPWEKKGKLVARGQINPPAHQAVARAQELVISTRDLLLNLNHQIEALDAGLDSYLYLDDFTPEFYSDLGYRIGSGKTRNYEVWQDLLNNRAHALRGRAEQEHARRLVRIARHQLESIAQYYPKYEIPDPLLSGPHELHPPRHAQLRDGVLARLFAEDLAVQIEAGRVFMVKPPTVPSVHEWREKAMRVLAGLTSDIPHGFERLTSGVAACDSSLVLDAESLSRAYVALGLAYLEEVQERMSDYAEASGQGQRRDPVTVIGNVGAINSEVHAAHFSVSDTETSIGATIEVLANGERAAAAAAIRCLTDAIQQATELAEEQRAELLDHVADVADAAAEPNEPRRLSRAKAAMARITTAAAASAPLARAIGTWHDVLAKFF